MTSTSEPRNVASRAGRWKPDETDLLLRRYAEGTPISAIALNLSRSETSINNRLHYLRRRGALDARRRAPLWTRADDATLAQHLAAGNTVGTIAQALGRGERAVAERAEHLAILGLLDSAARTHELLRKPLVPTRWSPGDDNELIERYERGETLAVMADALRRPAGSVYSRLQTLSRNGTSIVFRKPPWTSDRRQLLAKRRREGASLTQLAYEFDRARSSITSQLRVLRTLGYDVEPKSRTKTRRR